MKRYRLDFEIPDAWDDALREAFIGSHISGGTTRWTTKQKNRIMRSVYEGMLYKTTLTLLKQSFPGVDFEALERMEETDD